MSAMRGNVTRLLVFSCLALFLAGCPLKGDNGLTLILSPDSLNFGVDEESLIFQVHRNLTNAPVQPVVVSSSQPWIVPEACTSESENCLGTGIVDRLYIPIRVDRTKMLLGTNEGEVLVRTGGAATQRIRVYAEDTLFVDFLTSNRSPDVGQAVTFEDASERTEDAGDVISRVWDFGDNTQSTATDPAHVYTEPGLYSVSLTVTTTNGEETARKAGWITVGSPAPKTDFEASETSIFSGDAVVFTDLSISPTEPITSRLWDFGNGRTSTKLRPVNQYTRAGVFTVSLTVTTEHATRTETKSNYIVVQRKERPVADFAVVPSVPIAGQTANFGDNSDPGSAAIQDWFWDFGDGTTSRQQNPAHVFEDGGEYAVTLTVVSAHGSSSVTKTVVVDVIPPTAVFSISNTNPFVGDPVSFTNASTAGSAPISDYLWEFGDGSTSSDKDPTYEYNSAGMFIVRLTVITPHGSDTESRQITVNFMPPTAAFSVSDTTPSVGDTVQFMDESTPGTAAVNQWLWDFGDPDSGANNTSALKNPTHIYNSAGEYTITLTATTPVASDNSDTTQMTIRVVEPPVASFSFGADPDTPDIVEFVNTSAEGSEPITEFNWNFGDPDSGADNLSSAENPTHTFTTEGTFLVTLTVSTATQMEAVSNMVTVEFLPPEVDFTVETGPEAPAGTPIDVLADGALTTDTLRFNSFITLGTEMDTGLFQYTWDFGDGNMSDLEEPTHSYENGGSYTVTYTVTTPTQEATATQVIHVDEPPTPGFSALPRDATVGADVQFFDETLNPDNTPIVGYVWNFGDNSVAVVQEPVHAYVMPGMFTVSLEIRFNHSVTGALKSVTATEQDFIRVVQ